MEKNKLYVICLTYNQSKYICDTLTGFVIQKTTFPFVCCVIDDASTDGEQAVINQYLLENFSIDERYETDYAHISFARHKSNANCHFAVLLLKYNHHSINKNKRPYLSEWTSEAEYEALCEGDDYWTDPEKLQRQVDYLDSHPECGLCYTAAKVLNQASHSFEETIGAPCPSFEQLLKKNVVPTLTVVQRVSQLQRYFSDIQPDTKPWLMGDFPRWLWFSRNGGIHFMDVTTAVYRKLEESASHSLDYDRCMRFGESYVDICSFFSKLYGVHFDSRCYWNHSLKMYSRTCIDRGDFALARRFSKRIEPRSIEDFIFVLLAKTDCTLFLYRKYRQSVH